MLFSIDNIFVLFNLFRSYPRKIAKRSASTFSKVYLTTNHNHFHLGLYVYVVVYNLNLTFAVSELLMQRVYATLRRISIWQSIQKSMFQICRWLSLCRASNQGNMLEKPLLGWIITGFSQMMELSFSELTWIFLLRLFLLLWRNKLSHLVDLLVVHRVIVLGTITWFVFFFFFF